MRVQPCWLVLVLNAIVSLPAGLRAGSALRAATCSFAPCAAMALQLMDDIDALPLFESSASDNENASGGNDDARDDKEPISHTSYTGKWRSEWSGGRYGVRSAS